MHAPRYPEDEKWPIVACIRRKIDGVSMCPSHGSENPRGVGQRPVSPGRQSPPSSSATRVKKQGRGPRIVVPK